MEMKKIEQLVPYELNNKYHEEAAINRLANSISEFGWTFPILIDEQNIILAGHKRLLAALKLGLTEVPVIVKTGLSKAQKKAYRIIDNKSSEESEWDLPNLKLEIESLTEEGFSFDEFLLDDFPFEKAEAKTEEFEEFDDTIETAYRCPKCYYEWSGKAK